MMPRPKSSTRAGPGARRRRRIGPRRDAATSARALAASAPLWVRVAWMAAFALVLAGLIWVLRPVFAVLAASAGLAYILDPPTDWLERRGLSREASIGVVFTALLGGGALVMLLLVPGFVQEGREIATQIGPFIADLDSLVAPALAWASDLSGQPVTLDLADLQRVAPGWVADHSAKVQETGSALVTGLLTRGLGVLNTVLNLTLLPVFVFYLLRDWDRITTAIAGLVPPEHRPRIDRVASEVDRRLSAFVRGQITVSAIMAGLYSVGLLLVGIDLAIPIGVLSGLLFVVPYLGTAVGIVLATVLTLLKFGIGWELLQIAVVFAVVQGIEGYLLTPRIVGEQVGLHPLVVMIALIVGGSLLGIWGMLLAIPITAVLSVFGGEWIDLYRKSQVYGAGDLPEAREGADAAPQPGP
jgi:predicted PurR-regulated permease PerM